MNIKTFIIACAAVLAPALVSAQKYKYESVPGDPMQTRIYTLDNGLKVYLSVNKEKPRLQANIAVKTGSRNDPRETTGLAHYLEHLMFKGTTHFGSSDVAAEAPYLNDIERRYEAYRQLTDAEARRKAYHEIDSVSQLAARYNIPNEYDKMMASIGSEGSNAYTSNDVTCYVENIPNNEIDTWARIQADRFQNMVIRGFHTELEAVYEEYNIGLANDGRKEWAAFNKKLFPTHPYGTQTTIGTQAHLKNPSITNIKNYFRRYYVPNNVAICLAGDFDPDQVIAIIDKYFGSWKKSETLSRPEYPAVADLTQPVDTTVWGKEAENVILGWKMPAMASAQADTLNVIAKILSNDKAGLFDNDLVTPMKVLYAGASYQGLHDYGEFLIEGGTKSGQTLEDLRSLLLAEMDKLKKGEFSDKLLPAVVNNIKRDYYESILKNENRADLMVDAFINDRQWDGAQSLDRMAGMTKKQIVDFANKYFLDNYVTVFKRQGNDTTIHKIDKPAITPIPTNNDKQSDFLKAIVNEKPQPIAPKFVDFKKDMTVARMSNGAEVLYKQNNADDLFTLTFRYPFGTEADRAYGIAATYLDYVGTSKMTNQEVKERFYELACDYNVNVADDHIDVSVSGLNSNMPKALALLENLLNDAKADTASYRQFVSLLLKSRQDQRANQRANFYALRNLGCYGPWNSRLNTMSEAELRAADPQQLLNKLASLKNYTQTVLYFGATPLAALQQLVAKTHRTAKMLAAAPVGKPYRLQPTPKNEVWVAPYEAQNIYMTMYHNDGRQWKPENAALEDLFSEYFGGGMNAIVFQELREARGLAYSASAYLSWPLRPKVDTEAFATFIITQNDKMMDCVREFQALLDSMPERPANFQLAKQSLMKSIATARTTRYSVLTKYLQARNRGIDYDINQRVYADLPGLQLQDLVRFARENISHKPYRYLILGDEKALDMKALSNIAPVKHLTTKDIFGF